MATPPVRQWGVTPPISTVLPTKDEISANDDLISELKAQNNFEQPTETEQRCVKRFSWRRGEQWLITRNRQKVLQLLQRVTVEFVQVVSRKKGLSPAAVEASGGKIFTYGSYRLGVYGPGR